MRARAEQRVIELERELLARRGRVMAATASNSSLPPSANPIGAKPPVVKKPTGRKPGGQLGHKGTSRTLLPVEQVHAVIEHRPAVCVDCQQSISGDVAGDVVVGRHQVAELPPVAVVITEHRALACRCERCGALSRGQIPPDVRASVTGPRLSAAIGLLGASMKGSKRAIALMMQEVLSCPLALGSVSARERELSDALTGPYQMLVASAAAAPVKYVDETGWKLRGKSRWLFVSADSQQVIFRIERARTRPAFVALYGGGNGGRTSSSSSSSKSSSSIEPRPPSGVFCTDRAGIYDMLSIKARQLCWAHLIRDFVAAVERGGAGEAAATRMLAVANEMFELWHRFKKKKEITRAARAALRAGIVPLRQRMRDALVDGAACGQRKTAGLCRALLKREAALWRFAATPGLDPTNNLAERMLRGAVIWRKKSFGSASQAGCRYVERMLSVIETLRLRGHPPLAYLAAAIAAHRKGEPTPAIEPKPKPTETKLRKVA